MLRNFANGIAIFIDATEIITVIYPIRKMIPKIGEINMLENKNVTENILKLYIRIGNISIFAEILVIMRLFNFFKLVDLFLLCFLFLLIVSLLLSFLFLFIASLLLCFLFSVYWMFS